MTRTSMLALAALALAFAGCKETAPQAVAAQVAAPPAPVAAPAPAAVAAAPAVAPAAGHEGCQHHAQAPAAPSAPEGCQAAQQEGSAHECGAENVCLAAQAGDAVAATDPKTGKPMLTVGAKLAGAPVVALAALLKDPKAHAGKTVRLEGNVSAMCGHKRAWFALQDGERQGGFVRVITTPAFLVPPGSIGKQARAEGVLEVIEVPAGTAAHLAGEHKLGEAKAQHTVVMRATGAEFL